MRRPSPTPLKLAGGPISRNSKFTLPRNPQSVEGVYLPDIRPPRRALNSQVICQHLPSLSIESFLEDLESASRRESMSSVLSTGSTESVKSTDSVGSQGSRMSWSSFFSR